MTVYDETLSDGVGAAETQLLTGSYVTLSQGIGAGHSSILTGWYNSASDSIAFDVSKIKLGAAIGTALSQGIGMAPAVARVWRPGAVIAETVRVFDTLTPNQKLKTTLAEILGLTDALVMARQATLSDTVGMASSFSMLFGAVILDELGLLPALTQQAKYAQTILDLLRINDTLARFLGASVSDTIGANVALSLDVFKGVTVAEAIGLSPTLTPKLVVSLTVDEPVGIEDVDALQMIFSPTLSDGVEIGIGYLAPSGEFTTWAVNTRTAAVTEYSNYAFNSFAKIGTHYFGANSTGLYSLLGDTDDGSDIVADLKSGWMQLGGTRLAAFTAAYLGMRGAGQVLLKIVDGDGNTRVYQVTTESQRSTKVWLGKGLRSRYFSFELVTDGQDFDLDSVEFIPLVASRRV